MFLLVKKNEVIGKLEFFSISRRRRFVYICGAQKQKVLKFELFIARKTFFDRNTKKSFTRPIINIAIVGIALSLTVMLVSISILSGFKKEITNKVVGFANHIQIINYNSNNSFETQPIPKNLRFLPLLDSIPEVEHIQSFGLKAGIIKSNETIQGVVLKGISTDFNWKTFNQFIVEGEAIQLSDTSRTNDVLISKKTAKLMKLELGDSFTMFFIEGVSRMRFRKFNIKGIYSTSLEEFDNLYIIADLAHVQRLYGWNKNQVSGFELSLKDFRDVDYYSEMIEDMIGYEFLEDDSRIRIVNIKDKYHMLFDWLKLMDTNEIVILFLTIVVAGFNMMAGLLIIILERTNMIGVLKALGAQNWSVRKIFLYQSGFILLKGLFYGNLLALSISLLQKHFNIITLDEANYFIATVPVDIQFVNYLWVNLGTVAVVLSILIVPSYVISKISPEKTIKYD